jgi:hypothetical protein
VTYVIGEAPARYEARPKEATKGYPWPASKLNSEDMAKLTILRSQTNKPITQLLHEAVAMFYDVMRDEE